MPSQPFAVDLVYRPRIADLRFLLSAHAADLHSLESRITPTGSCLAFGRLRTYQCSVLHSEQMIDLDFGPLREHDDFSNKERATGRAVERAVHGSAGILR